MGQALDINARLAAAVNDHDLATMGELFSDEAVVSDPDGEVKGREAIVAYFREWFEAFPDFKARDELTAEAGDVVLNQWVLFGTNSGPMQTPEGAIPPTGKHVTVRGCDVVIVQDGRIQAYRAYYDRLTLMTQLGLATEEAPA